MWIEYKPKTNSRIVQVERNRSGARIVTGGQGGQGTKGGEGATVQAKVPDESQADVSVHDFWKWGTFALFDTRIVNLDASSYL